MYRVIGWSIVSILFPLGLYGQSLEWVYLPFDTTINTCVSQTDETVDQRCFGLIYTPSVTGTLTSYTSAFFVDVENH